MKQISIEKTTKNSKYLADQIFAEKLRQQTVILNNEFQSIVDTFKLIKSELKEINSRKSLSVTPLQFKYNKDTKLFEYLNKNSVNIINNKRFEFIAVYKSYDGKSNLKTEELLSKLSILKPLLIEAVRIFNTKSGILISDINENYALAYISNIETQFSISNKHVLVLTQSCKTMLKDESPTFTCIYSNEKDNKSNIIVSQPVSCSENKSNFTILTSISYNEVISKLYKVFEGKTYENYNRVRLIINKTGELIYLPFKYYSLFSLPFDNDDKSNSPEAELADASLTLSKDPAVRKFAKQLMTQESGMLNVYLKGNEYSLVFDKLPVNNWTTALLVKKKDLYGPLRRLEKRIKKIFTDIFIRYIINFLIILIIGILLSLFIFNRIIIKPIEILRKSVKKLGKGNFDIKLREKGIREICDLSISFNKLGSQLKNYTKKLEEQKALETELKIAAKLQNSVLPKITDKFKREEFELYTKLIPATKMSGDFYDFFFVNENTIALVLADVSGKGLTAAFFMSMSKAIIKESCLTSKTLPPGKILEYVNNILYKDNESSMFLTMYLIFYEINTGKITYANAGHHEFILTDKNGNVSSSGIQNNPSIGIAENVKYSTKELLLNNDDIFAVYTDGITEAPNKENVEYSTEKLIKIFESIHRNKLPEIGKSIIKDVLEYQNGDKFDDITLLMLKKLK
ncbi:MAG: PP2C family protein-serine/threonine phosphatase [bacterium]|nr:PP2C family protein-serine/threonine phosphatase [bacterium]